MEGKKNYSLHIHMCICTCVYNCVIGKMHIHPLHFRDPHLWQRPIRSSHIRHMSWCVFHLGWLSPNSWSRISYLRVAVESHASNSGRKAAHLCQWASRFSSAVCLSLARVRVSSYLCCRAAASWTEQPLSATFWALAEVVATALLSASRAWQRS